MFSNIANLLYCVHALNMRHISIQHVRRKQYFYQIVGMVSGKREQIGINNLNRLKDMNIHKCFLAFLAIFENIELQENNIWCIILICSSPFFNNFFRSYSVLTFSCFKDILIQISCLQKLIIVTTNYLKHLHYYLSSFSFFQT